MNALTNSAAPAISEADMVDYYLTQLMRLSPAAKLEVIARLAQTLQAPPSAAQSTLPDFIGAWANDPEADKMEEAIRANRHSMENA